MRRSCETSVEGADSKKESSLACTSILASFFRYRALTALDMMAEEMLSKPPTEHRLRAREREIEHGGFSAGDTRC